MWLKGLTTLLALHCTAVVSANSSDMDELTEMLTKLKGEDGNSQISNLLSILRALFATEDKEESSMKINTTSTITSTTTRTTTSATSTSSTTATSMEGQCDHSPPGQVSKPTKMTRYHTSSIIQLRYSRTTMEAEVVNEDLSFGQHAAFAMLLPEAAFISNFSMEIGGRQYVAKVDDKAAAKAEFDAAVSKGMGAGLVSQDARDANKFTVSTFVGAGASVVFRLVYEELLERKGGSYQLVVKPAFNTIVNDYKIEVTIKESLPIKQLWTSVETDNIDPKQKAEETKCSSLASNMELCSLNSVPVKSKGVVKNGLTTKISVSPNAAEQKDMGEKEMKKLVVRYDVDRSSQDNEVQVVDGHFVHFFVPDNLKTMAKHVIFILDVSGSMSGEKMEQMKDAMFTILNAMTDRDSFNIITFSNHIRHFSDSSEEGSGSLDSWGYKYNPPSGKPSIMKATKDNRNKAIKYVMSLRAGGGTDIDAALKAGLQVAKEKADAVALLNHVMPATSIVFLSDGEASSGVTDSQTIKANVVQLNKITKVPIFSVAFGRGADFNLLKGISESNNGFVKRVYEDGDAALQLEDCFSLISSPQITDLKFDYKGIKEESISDTDLATFFEGGQFIVTGKVETGKELSLTVSGNKNEGKYLKSMSTCNQLRPVPKPKPFETCHMQRTCNKRRPPQCFSKRICRPSCYKYSYRGCCRAKHCTCPRLRPYWTTRCPRTPTTTPRPMSPCLSVKQIPPRSEAQEFMQRLHAFLNIKQLMKKEKEREAKEIALRSNFVTPLTSLVVVKPCEGERTTDPEESFEERSKGRVGRSSQSYYGKGSYASTGYGRSGYGGRRGRSSRSIKMSTKRSKKRSRKSSKATTSLRGRKKNKSYQSRRQPRKAGNSKNKKAGRKKKGRSSRDQSQEPGSGAGYDAEYEDSGSGPLQSKEIDEEACSLQLYSQTYHRGTEMNTTDSNPDLGSFADKAVSAITEGDCCWTLFEDRNYRLDAPLNLTFDNILIRGSKIVLYPGRDYKSATSLGSLLTEASSVKKTKC